MIGKIKKRRRRTALRTLIVTFAIATALCAAFVFGVRRYRISVMKDRCLEQLDYTETRVRRLLSQERNPQYNYTLADLRCILTRYASFRIRLPLFDEKNSEPSITNKSEGCHAFAFTWDKDGNPVVSSRLTLQAYFQFSEDEADGGNYICEDLGNIPEVRRLYEDYGELIGRKPGEDAAFFTEMTMKSAYINREEHTFIPAVGELRLMEYDTVTNDLFEPVAVETKVFDITVADEHYELVGFDTGKAYPRAPLKGFFGADSELTERVYREDISDDGAYPPYYMEKNPVVEGGVIRARRVFDLGFLNEKYPVCLYYIVDCNAPEIVKYDRKIIIPICLAVYVLAALICWRRIVINKTKYAMEDYQRDLTNHLAHDIKTPLMAIGGYAENVKEVDLTEEEKNRYLDAILENVGFADSIVKRTLFLNTMEERSRKPEIIDVLSVAAGSLKKYGPLLDEKGIMHSVEGSASVKADRTTFESIVENIISNAVKYTPENGVIKAVADDRKLVVTNTVKQKVDVGNLTTPFVRGEEARSNLGGSGLGLSIAERAAAMNGFALKLSCTDEEFRTELKISKVYTRKKRINSGNR